MFDDSHLATDHGTTFMPTAIHRAIDEVTILKMEVHSLRRCLLSGEAIDPDRLLVMDQILNHLTAALRACRDRDPFAP